jgi:hypothetical protein
MATKSSSRQIRIDKRRIEKEMGPKPEMRISDSEAKKLKRIAIFAEVIDSVGGLFPAIGDLGAWLFNWALTGFFYWRYDISFSSFLKKGSGGMTGTFLLTLGELLVGLVPIVGDLADVFYTSWYYKVSSSINKIQEEDKEKIRKYKKKKKRLIQKLSLIQQNQAQAATLEEQDFSDRQASDRQARRMRLQTKRANSSYRKQPNNTIGGIRQKKRKRE